MEDFLSKISASPPILTFDTREYQLSSEISISEVPSESTADVEKHNGNNTNESLDSFCEKINLKKRSVEDQTNTSPNEPCSDQAALKQVESSSLKSSKADVENHNGFNTNDSLDSNRNLKKESVEDQTKCSPNEPSSNKSILKQVLNSPSKSSDAETTLKSKPIRKRKKETFVCTICNKEFNSSVWYWSHYNSKHVNKKWHKCSECDKKFADKRNLTRHLQSYHRSIDEASEEATIMKITCSPDNPKVLSFNCNICDQKYQTFNRCKTHYTNKHVNKKWYSCSECDKIFSSSSSLSNHVKKLHKKEKISSKTKSNNDENEKDQKCTADDKKIEKENCSTDKQTTDQENCITKDKETDKKIHKTDKEPAQKKKRIRRAKKKHSSNDETTDEQSSLTDDETQDQKNKSTKRRVKKKKPTYYESTDEENNTTSNETTDQKTKTKKVKRKVQENDASDFVITDEENCKTGEEIVNRKKKAPKVKRRFQNNKPLDPEITTAAMIEQQKIKVSKNGDQVTYICDICQKGFNDKRNCFRHYQRHIFRNHYKCEQCGKGFFTSKMLLIHSRLHTNERPFQCEQCGKCFTSKESLKIHMVVHDGQKKFVCQICNKAFVYKSSLRSHCLTHTKEKPHLCEVCGKSFSEKNNLKRHKLTHTHVKRYLCHICDKAFAHSNSLKSHLTTHESNPDPEHKKRVVKKKTDHNGRNEIQRVAKEITQHREWVANQRLAHGGWVPNQRPEHSGWIPNHKSGGAFPFEVRLEEPTYYLGGTTILNL